MAICAAGVKKQPLISGFSDAEASAEWIRKK